MMPCIRSRETDATRSRLLLREIGARSLLTASGIEEYCVNPYVGCEHACRYCYASFMCRFTGHEEPWGTFVDVRVNAPELLVKELKRKKVGRVMVSSVTDPYQSMEAHYLLTRRCLEALAEAGWSVRVLTKSSLVRRDMDIFKHFRDVEVGLTITTDDDSVRRLMEPHASPIEERLRVLEDLTSAGIKTYAFVGPILPMDPHALARLLRGKTPEVVFDRMNYPWKIRWIYSRFGWTHTLTDDYVAFVRRAFYDVLGKEVTHEE